MSQTIFDKSKTNRGALSQFPKGTLTHEPLAKHELRRSRIGLPEVSELQAIRHFTQLSQKNFSIDSHFYPLGSCTMKYNPRGAHKAASFPDFLNRHPYAHLEQSQGFMQCLFELQEYLKSITGMTGVSLTPMAGAQGEFAGVAMIKAYHQANQDTERTDMLVPDSAHGTNPASAVMCGYRVLEVATHDSGDMDVEDLKSKLSHKTAGIMLTNPSTLGLFERNILEISELVHQAGGLLYYDGANLNAILGKVRPGDMGFDVMHLNLHKTFATPHGGGGPGAGPVAVNDRLKPFLPVPVVDKKAEQYVWLTEKENPQTIGRLSAFAGNAGILLRAYAYIRLLGEEGLKRVSDFAVLNANYLMQGLKKAGVEIAFPERRATHEFIITMKGEAKTLDVTAMDFAKRLLDYNIHAPTTYFPLLIPECWLIEPTETETKETLDRFIEVLTTLYQEAKQTPDILREAPMTMPVGRLDDVKAARELDLSWSDG